MEMISAVNPGPSEPLLVAACPLTLSSWLICMHITLLGHSVSGICVMTEDAPTGAGRVDLGCGGAARSILCG
ncbi:hypothetical protein BJX62DRAFT_207606 [Aspergillus germanicus]